MRGFSSVLACPRLGHDLGDLPSTGTGSAEGTTETGKHLTAWTPGVSLAPSPPQGRPVFCASRLLLAGLTRKTGLWTRPSRPFLPPWPPGWRVPDDVAVEGDYLPASGQARFVCACLPGVLDGGSAGRGVGAGFRRRRRLGAGLLR